jgi:prepilin-type N-terminal cleavage/methylation domain-containing protein
MNNVFQSEASTSTTARSADSRSRGSKAQGAVRSSCLKSHGFTLVEVVIVSVVLTVLLAAVWSLFTLQQRTLERGQRLSRQSRVMLAMQRLLQEDLARTASVFADNQIPIQPMSSASPQDKGDDSASPASASIADFVANSQTDTIESLIAPQFMFAGGTDWLIVDVRRPAYQLGAFDPTSTADNDPAESSVASGTTSTNANTANSYSANQLESLPTNPPTPFERVIYLWLTDEEIQEVSGVVFGYAESVAKLAESERETTSNLATPRRTLLRIRIDWSWPREDEGAGTTWDTALLDDTAATDFSGVAENESGLTPERQAWLRRLLWTTRTGYRDYHLQAGSALLQGQEDSATSDLGQANNSANSLFEEANADGNPDGSLSTSSSDDANQQRFLPNAREPQVDWFPEVIAGKFQYFDGTTWQDSFVQREDFRLPWAVRLQFELQANRFPTPVDFPAINPGEADVQDALLTGNLRISLPQFNDPSSSLASIANSDRPEYSQVVVWTYRQQATSRTLDSEMSSRFESELTGGVDANGPAEGASDAAGFAEAFNVVTRSESGSR